MIPVPLQRNEYLDNKLTEILNFLKRLERANEKLATGPKLPYFERLLMLPVSTEEGLAELEELLTEEDKEKSLVSIFLNY